MKKLLLALFSVACWASWCTAQSSYRYGLMPTINLNTKVSKAWKLNFSTQSRINSPFFEDDAPFEVDYTLTDFSVLASKNIGLSSKLAAGYLVRLRSDGRINHRLIQQLAFVSTLDKINLVHRFSMDQTFGDSDAVEIRMRYRIGTQIALRGDRLDAKEVYFKITNEYLNSFESGEYDLEIRVVPLIGFAITRTSKLEFGLDYRFDSFISESFRESYWTRLNWFYSF